jgi:hypothetical protein
MTFPPDLLPHKYLYLVMVTDYYLLLFYLRVILYLVLMPCLYYCCILYLGIVFKELGGVCIQHYYYLDNSNLVVILHQKGKIVRPFALIYILVMMTLI